MADAVDMVVALGGEIVTYMPWNGVPTTFKAIVHRRPTQVEGGGRPYTKRSIELDIPKDATNGVTGIKEGHDTVRFKFNLADAQDSTFTVAKIMSQDAGLVASDLGSFHVECHG